MKERRKGGKREGEKKMEGRKERRKGGTVEGKKESKKERKTH